MLLDIQGDMNAIKNTMNELKKLSDEEKAEERYCKTCKKKNNCFHKCDVFIEYTKGLAEGKKEGYEQGVLKDCLKVACPNCKPSIENYCIDCEYANFIIDKDNQIYKLEKENEKLKAQITELEKRISNLKIKNASLQRKNEQQAKQIEQMRCCGNCNEPCWNPPTVRKSECLSNNLSLWELAE